MGAARPDGYHELVTVFQAVSIHDVVTATPADGVELVVSGGTDGVPTDGRNLACRAARLLARTAGVPAAVRLELDKRIPVAGGMAGGSADAAAALLACDRLWGTGLDRAALLELAAELGSDVPFALTGGTAVGTGRGERLTPVLAPGQWHWVFGIADGGLSTPQVYGELDRLRTAGGPGGEPTVTAGAEPAALLAALRGADPRQLAAALGNDLQPAALSLRPQLRQGLRAGAEAGALAGIVSGSGPTCAFLARDADHAVRLAATLSGAGQWRTVRVAHGPVPGARLLEG